MCAALEIDTKIMKGRRFDPRGLASKSLTLLLLSILVCSLSLQSVRSEGSTVSDPMSDFLDANEKATSAEAYLDIVSGKVYWSGQVWVMELSVSSVFSQYESTTVVVEWGIGIDSDMSWSTGQQRTQPGNVWWNRLGIDYWAKITYDPRRTGNKTMSSLWRMSTTGKADLIARPKFNMMNKTFIMELEEPSIGSPIAFQFLLMTQKVSNIGDQWKLLAYDKAPNEGFLMAVKSS